jgi:Cu/Ag efflux pump CusA
LLPLLVPWLCAGCLEGMARKRQAVVVTITAEAPGYGVDQVEEHVAAPMAIALAGMPGVKGIRSRVTSGRTVTWVEFVPGTDVYKARQATAERLQRAVFTLPKAVVPTLAPAMAPDEVMLIALRSAGQAPDEPEQRAMQLRAIADEVVRRRLLAVPGVAEVVVTGGLVGQCQVIVSPEKTAQHALAISEVVSATEKALAEHMAQPGKQETLVVRAGLTLDGLGEIVLAVREGNAIRLRDVAEVRLGGLPPHGARSRPHGEIKSPPQPAVLLGVIKQPDFEAKRLSRGLDVALDELRPTLPPDLSLGRQLPPELAPLASRMAEDIQEDQPPEVTLQQQTSADLGSVLMRKSPPRTTIAIIGPERRDLSSVGRDLADRLRKVPGVAEVHVDSLEEVPQIQVDVDQQKAASLAVSMTDILAAVELAQDGRKVGRLKDPRTGQAVDVVVTCGRDMRNAPEFLQRLPLTTATRETVPLAQLARIETVSVPRSLTQVQMQRAVLISCEVQTRDREQTMAEIKRAIAACPLPAGCHVESD